MSIKIVGRPYREVEIQAYCGKCAGEGVQQKLWGPTHGGEKFVWGHECVRCRTFYPYEGSDYNPPSYPYSVRVYDDEPMPDISR